MANKAQTKGWFLVRCIVQPGQWLMSLVIIVVLFTHFTWSTSGCGFSMFSFHSNALVSTPPCFCFVLTCCFFFSEK
ncbi:hypothetical protein V1514DRAFT_328712 [Lipomyces japonicus]|uniref:uncharacterized protein n=1 Tax=Lipomyces japonicus TaxID=56871 RepID=UPI0034CF2BAA